jgi:hypothetical protein
LTAKLDSPSEQRLRRPLVDVATVRLAVIFDIFANDENYNVAEIANISYLLPPDDCNLISGISFSELDIEPKLMNMKATAPGYMTIFLVGYLIVFTSLLVLPLLLLITPFVQILFL